MNRRHFIAAGAAALAISGCNESGRVAIDPTKAKKIQEEKRTVSSLKGVKKKTLKIATSWPAHFPIMGTGVEQFAKRVYQASGGTLEIKLYPKNTLIPALAVFDACSQGQIDGFHSGPYYWKGKNSAFSLFSGIPFGLSAEEINAWMLYGGGMALWRELYARYNLYPFLGGNTNIQMGGWFRKPINTIKDMHGLKMRIPGLGGEVFAKMGVNPVLLPAGEIYTSLERGVIDACEWVGPALDIKMGFYKVAPYYYSGWNEPGSVLELTFNKKSFENLSDFHKSIIEVCASELNASMMFEFQYANAKALKELKGLGVKMMTFSDSINEAGRAALKEVIDEQSKDNKDFKRIIVHIEEYLQLSKPWSEVSLQYFLNVRNA